MNVPDEACMWFPERDERDRKITWEGRRASVSPEGADETTSVVDDDSKSMAERPTICMR